MADNAWRTLLHPFGTGSLELPEDGDILFVNACVEALTVLPPGRLSAVQDFRPSFLALEQAGVQATPDIPQATHEMALVLCGRHRRQNEHWIAVANERVRPGGLVVVAGLKTDGIAALRKGLVQPIAGQEAKHHGTVFWFAADGSAAPRRGETTVAGRFTTGPGMFSHERIDPGSSLLADNLPASLSGEIVDLCAGWGYLAVEAAVKCPKASRIDLYEASHAALAAARANMARLAPSVPSDAHWFDVAGEAAPRRYDAAIMNPPFHEGRSGDPAIGQRIIAAAASFLKPSGRLVMVANRHLPYEATLAGDFATCREIARGDGFKVLAAARPRLSR